MGEEVSRPRIQKLRQCCSVLTLSALKNCSKIVSSLLLALLLTAFRYPKKKIKKLFIISSRAFRGTLSSEPARIYFYLFPICTWHMLYVPVSDAENTTTFCSTPLRESGKRKIYCTICSRDEQKRKNWEKFHIFQPSHE